MTQHQSFLVLLLQSSLVVLGLGHMEPIACFHQEEWDRGHHIMPSLFFLEAPLCLFWQEDSAFTFEIVAVKAGLEEAGLHPTLDIQLCYFEARAICCLQIKSHLCSYYPFQRSSTQLCVTPGVSSPLDPASLWRTGKWTHAHLDPIRKR